MRRAQGSGLLYRDRMVLGGGHVGVFEDLDDLLHVLLEQVFGHEVRIIARQDRLRVNRTLHCQRPETQRTGARRPGTR